MRLVVFALALGLSAPSVLAQETRPSHLSCDSSKIGARELADCLRLASEKSDQELKTTVEAAVKSVDSKPKMLSSQKSRWKRSLNEAQAQWLTWRDAECQDVAPFEAGMNAKGGDPRLSCIIDQNAHRLADIKARYP
jgi:uncharacterized protein YecT (DUF1311 family)